MKITLIAAIGKHREIGRENTLLWSLPQDMKHFRARTNGHPVIMGRKTFVSIGHPLPNRTNIILSRSPSTFERQENMYIATSPQEAIDIVQKHHFSECFCIGGSEIYALFLPLATYLSLTHVNAEFPEADSFFPLYDTLDWKEESQRHIPKDEKNIYDCNIIEYKRIGRSPDAS